MLRKKLAPLIGQCSNGRKKEAEKSQNTPLKYNKMTGAYSENAKGEEITIKGSNVQIVLPSKLETVHTYSIENGIMHINSKNDLRKADMIGRSPDSSDALAIWDIVRKRAFHWPRKMMGEPLDYGRMNHSQFKRAAW